MFGLQTSLVLDYTIRSTAEEKGKRNPPQTCLHKMLSASTGLTASLERAAAKLQGWFGLMEPHSWTPGLGLRAPLGGLCGAVDLELAPSMAPAPSSVSPKDPPLFPWRLLWPLTPPPFLAQDIELFVIIVKWLKQAV